MSIRSSCLVALLMAAALPGCMESDNQRANYPPGYQPYPPGYQCPPGQQCVPPQQCPPGQQCVPPQPGQPPPGQPNQPGQPPQQNLPPVAYDPINATDINFLRGRAQIVIQELVAALKSSDQSQVSGIPLIIDDRVGEVNAFAACTQGGKKVMAISDGLLDIEAHLAQARANDEIFHTNKTNEYIQLIAKNQKPGSPIVQPPAGFFDPAQQTNGNRVKRQHEILDEEIGFVLGHELGHHYLGHLPCSSSGGGVTAAEIGHVLSSAVPFFNQPNEIAADISGTSNILDAGARRPAGTYKLTEGGGLLTMQFFAGIDQFSPADIVFGFERSHPPPQIRTPIIQQTASNWRSSGGKSASPFPFPLPF